MKKKNQRELGDEEGTIALNSCPQEFSHREENCYDPRVD